MKSKRKITLVSLIAAFIMASCAQLPDLSAEFEVERPEAFAFRNYLASYGPLKSYIDRAQNPNFKLGAATTMPDFVNGGVVYRLLVSNFDQVTLENAMAHESIVQPNGYINAALLESFLAAAERAGVSVYGHPLVWHNRQRAAWLNYIIAPEPIFTELVQNGDFATDNFHSFEVRRPEGGAIEIVDIVGVEGIERAWRLPSPDRTGNPWGREFFFRNFDPRAQVGDVLHLSMDIRSDAPTGAIHMQTHSTPGNAPHQGVQNINSTTEWQRIEISVPITQVRVGTTPGVSTLCFHIGHIETTLYVANVSVILETLPPPGPTPERAEIITAELGRWIRTMLEATPDIRRWTIVNDPISNTAPFWVRPVPTSPGANQFFWQQFLGDEFAATAIKFARRYGRPDIQLFINDYGLEGDGEFGKLYGLLDFIAYTESQGVVVDGIGTKMHISLDTPRENIVGMFQRLAATGKLIKITELNIRLSDEEHSIINVPGATPELLRAQADLYRFVVEQYFAIIPAAQRAGITFWTPLDSPDATNTSDWVEGIPTPVFRRNEPVGLWSAGATTTGSGANQRVTARTNPLRKHSYAGVVNGLQGRPLTSDEVIESNF